MKRSHLLGIALVGALGFMSVASAANDEPVDDRFYVAPMASYGFFGEDTFKPEDEIGAKLAIGKTLTEYLALELYAFNFNDVDITRKSGNIDSMGYGLSALLFPARDLFPIFAIVGIGEGSYDFDQVVPAGNPGDINDQDMSFVDLGIGVLIPITDYGISLRAEYRYRTADVDAVNGGEYNFRNDIVSVGVQIPLGAPPEPEMEPVTLAPEPEPAPVVPPQPTDSDGDGVPDDRDRCPGTPAETDVNRFGCPVEKEESIVLKGVHFQYDSAALTAEAEDRLDSVVQALKRAEQIDVKIAGHTDSHGSAAYNLKLSKERADSVKEYLVNHGIDADRLTTVGYGETRPIAPNTEPDGSDNPEGRAKNRRVELHVIEEASGS